MMAQKGRNGQLLSQEVAMVILQRFNGAFFFLRGINLSPVSAPWALYMIANLPITEHFTATDGVYWHLEYNGTQA